MEEIKKISIATAMLMWDGCWPDWRCSRQQQIGITSRGEGFAQREGRMQWEVSRRRLAQEVSCRRLAAEG